MINKRLSLIVGIAAVMTSAVGVSFGQAPQPYAGLQARSIKALSDRELADLRAGRGMGLALPAELNGYPGPLHVIELADALALRPEQRNRMQRLFETMRAETTALGEQLIAEESDLDRQFADRTITPVSLDAATARIGQTQAALRATHLRYHLITVEVLTPDQAQRYAELRGYTGGATSGGHRPGMHQR